jgi:DNA-binding response OmpR family regulator
MPKKAKILIIEDEPAVSMMMVHLLTRAGCEVATAWDAAKGMELAEAGNFDLITLDVDLSGLGLSGFEICHRLKEEPRLRHTPVVFVSGRFSQEDARHGLELGAVDYITKPFGAADFAARIISHTTVKTRPAKQLPPERATA